MQKLQVPDNISLRPEVVRGISPKALAASLAAAAMTAAASAAVCLLFPSEGGPVKAALLVLFVFALCLGFLARMENGRSIYDYLRCIQSYRRGQQTFLYVRKEVLYHDAPQEENA